MPNFVKLDFELVDLLQDRPKPGDFGVGDSHGVAGAVVLRLRADLSLLCQLDHVRKRSALAPPFEVKHASETYRFHPDLDRLHQPVEMIAERLQAARIQQQSAMAGRRAGCAGRAAPPSGAASAGAASGLGEGDLLMLTQDLDLVRGQAELGVRDGLGGGHEGRSRMSEIFVRAMLQGRRGVHVGVKRS